MSYNAIDQTSDPGYSNLRALLKIHKSAYSLVKEAEMEDDFSSLPDEAFAWSGERKYPIHNPEQAILSYLYTKISHIPADVKTKIAEALDVYRIDVNLLNIPTEKVATSSDYIFPENQLYQIKTASDIPVAEKRLHEQLPKLSTERRATAFNNLYKIAQKHNVALQPESYRYAGVVVTDAVKLSAALDARISATKNVEIQGKYAALNKQLFKVGKIKNRELQLKLASHIDDLDKKAGVIRFYDKYAGLENPLTAVFNTTNLTKVAGTPVVLGDMTFPLEQLAGIDPQTYGDVLGPDIVPEIQTAPGGGTDPQKLMEIINTLPSDLKNTLAQHLKTLLG